MPVEDFKVMVNEMTDEEIFRILDEVADNNVQSPEISEYLEFLRSASLEDCGAADYTYLEEFGQDSYETQVPFVYAA